MLPKMVMVCCSCATLINAQPSHRFSRVEIVRKRSDRGSTMTRTIAGALALVVCMLLGDAVRAETLDQLYAKAKDEGALHIYGGGPARLYEGWVKEYEARFPGIKVTIHRRLCRWPRAQDRQGDRGEEGRGRLRHLPGGAGIHPLEAGRRAAAVQDGRLRGARSALPRSRTAPSRRSACSRSRRPTTPSWWRPTDAPRSAQDFLKPVFRGKLITAYPSDDDATLFAFYTIVKKYGWGFMDDYMKQQPKFIQGHLGVVRSIGSGESAATFDMMLHHTMVEKAEGKPIEVAFPADDALPIWGQLARDLQGFAASERRAALSAMVHGRRSSRRASAPGRRAPTCRRRSVLSRSSTTTSPTTTPTSSPIRTLLARSAQALRALHRRGQEHRRHALERSQEHTEGGNVDEPRLSRAASLICAATLTGAVPRPGTRRNHDQHGGGVAHRVLPAGLDGGEAGLLQSRRPRRAG